MNSIKSYGPYAMGLCLIVVGLLGTYLTIPGFTSPGAAISAGVGLILAAISAAHGDAQTVKTTTQTSVAIGNQAISAATDQAKETARSVAIQTIKAASVILLAILLFGGNASAQPQLPSRMVQPAVAAQPLSQLKQIVLDDLQAALEDANANNDPDGASCWQKGIDIVSTITLPTPGKAHGLIYGIQRARDLVGKINGPLPRDLIRACAVVIADAKIDTLKFAAMFKGIFA